MNEHLNVLFPKLIIVLVCGCILFFSPEVSMCQEEYKTDADEATAYNVTRTVKTVDGLHFVVEEDRPITKVAGVYKPIDIDSYVALKFNKLDKKIDDIAAVIQQRLDDLSARLDLLTQKVNDLSREISALRQNQVSQNQTQSEPPPATPQTP